MKSFMMVVFGAAFGFVLSRSGASDYDYIQRMFLFQDLQLYGIIGAAVAVTMPGLWLIKRHGKTISGVPLEIKRKPRHRGNILGGILFGVGWSMTGMCPGPILVNLGEGKLYALSALVGAVLGAYLFGSLYSVLEKPLRLPPMEQGPGAG